MKKFMTLAVLLTSSIALAEFKPYISVTLKPDGARQSITKVFTDSGQQRLKLSLPRANYAKETHYAVIVNIEKTGKTFSEAKLNIIESITHPDDATREYKTAVNNYNSVHELGPTQDQVVYKELYRADLTLISVRTQKEHNFLTYSDINQYEPETAGSHQWDCKSNDCQLPGWLNDIVAYPLMWAVQFSPHINETSVLAYGEGQYSNPKLVSKEVAVKIVTARTDANYDELAKEISTWGQTVTPEEVEHAKSFSRSWTQTTKKLAENSDYVYCDDDTYWSPSVNSSICYFVDLKNKKVTRIDHGDTDG